MVIFHSKTFHGASLPGTATVSEKRCGPVRRHVYSDVAGSKTPDAVGETTTFWYVMAKLERVVSAALDVVARTAPDIAVVVIEFVTLHQCNFLLLVTIIIIITVIIIII